MPVMRVCSRFPNTFMYCCTCLSWECAAVSQHLYILLYMPVMRVCSRFPTPSYIAVYACHESVQLFPSTFIYRCTCLSWSAVLAATPAAALRLRGLPRYNLGGELDVTFTGGIVAFSPLKTTAAPPPPRPPLCVCVCLLAKRRNEVHWGTPVAPTVIAGVAEGTGAIAEGGWRVATWGRHYYAPRNG